VSNLNHSIASGNAGDVDKNNLCVLQAILTKIVIYL